MRGARIWICGCLFLASALGAPAVRAQASLGAACQVADDCDSLNCVGGICCDTACESSCESCLSALTGFANGVCRPVASGNPDPSGVCSAATCSGVTLFGGTCNGLGGCQTASQSCAPFACNAEGTGCNVLCSSDSDCAPGATCDGVTCLAIEAGLSSGVTPSGAPAWSCAIGARPGENGMAIVAGLFAAWLWRRRASRSPVRAFSAVRRVRA